MKKKSNLIFIFIVFLVVVYTIFDYSKLKYEEEDYAESKLIFENITIGEVKEFKLTDNKKIIFLKKENEVWKMIAPISYPADQDYVNGFIQQLIDDQLESLINLADDQIFSGATLNIGLKLKNGVYRDFLVSKVKTSDGRAYLKDIKTDKIFVGSPLWVDLNKEGVFSFRWKNIFAFRSKIKSISVFKSNNKSYTFSYDQSSNSWPAKYIQGLVFSDKKIAQLLSLLLHIKVSKFVSETKSNKLLNRFDLLSPILKIKIQFEEKSIQDWVMLVSQLKNGYHFITFEKRPQILQLSKDDVNKIKSYLNDLD